MSSKDLDWTNRRTDHALIVLTAVKGLIEDYGMQLLLEALIHNNDETITAASVFGTEDDYLYSLKHDLETALDNYNSRYDEKSGPKPRG